MRFLSVLLVMGWLLLPAHAQEPSALLEAARNERLESWRRDHRLIDLHQHIEGRPERIERAVKIMDAVGIGIGVNLSGGTTLKEGEKPSALERNIALFEEVAPGRFVQYMNLDYSGFDEEGWGERAAAQVEAGFRQGAAGLKEYKRLGLYLRHADGTLIAIDDPKLDPVWAKCGELGLPVSIHVADPKAFWAPFDESNERWIELKDHKDWWFGDPDKYPPREELLAARNRVIQKHPKTTFVCLHFANNPEDVVQVGKWLEKYPNMMVDLAARVPEIGRHDPKVVRDIFVKHQDRILFATDFMVYGRLILGSGGDGPAPTDADAIDFYEKHWRFLETNDRSFAHMTPIQGDWTIDAIGLPEGVLRKIYFDNARKLLAKSLPAPVATAQRVDEEVGLDPRAEAWNVCEPVYIDQQSLTAEAKPALETEVRLAWSDTHLTLRYHCPYTELTVFEPPMKDGERMGLWDKDVIEAFIAPDAGNAKRYVEVEVAPTNERLDVLVDLPEKDFDWSSGAETKVLIDEEAKVWWAVVRIPWTAFGKQPNAGDRWKMNLYRCDRAGEASLAWRPVLRGSFHAPDRFGLLEFAE